MQIIRKNIKNISYIIFIPILILSSAVWFSDDEMARAKDIAEFDHKLKRYDNDDKKEDQIRAMAWFALWGMLLYPILILITSIIEQDTASQLISDIAPTYFVAIAGLVAAFFGAQAYSKKSETKK